MLVEQGRSAVSRKSIFIHEKTVSQTRRGEATYVTEINIMPTDSYPQSPANNKQQTNRQKDR